MKKLLVSGILSITLSIAGQIQDLSQSVKTWGAVANIQNNHLVITTPQNRVNDKIFQSIIQNGICMHSYFTPNLLNGIKDIYVMNKYNKQGYVLEGSSDICSKIGNMKDDNKVKLYLISKSHMY